MYVTGCFDDAVSWYDQKPSTGALTYGGMLKDGVNGVDGLDYAISVTLSSDGNHAYVTGSVTMRLVGMRETRARER